MKVWRATIKEVGGAICTPTYSDSNDSMTREDLINFWGLNEPDVESYELTVEIINFK